MINLLPPKYKEELKGEENLNLVLILEVLFLAFSLSLALVLFSIKIHIGSAVETQKILFEVENKEFTRLKSAEEKLNYINKEISSFESFYKNQLDLTDFLGRISGLLPEGLYLNSFYYQKEEQKISLSGFSPRVETLLEFKNNLEKQKDFKEVYFPNALWLQPENINFNTSFKIGYEQK